MMRKTIKMLTVILVMAFNSLVFCNSIEDGWQGIKPLKTSRKAAEEVLGTPEKVTKFGYFNYRTADFFAQADYSDTPCEESSYGRGDYNVPPETVLNYKVILYKQIKLDDLKFQRKKYRRSVDSEMIGLVYYINADDGIMISVGTKDGIEYVGEIRFSPSPSDKKKFECKKTEEIIDNSIEDGWKNIKPLVTDRTTTERILNSLNASNNGYSNYQTSEFFIQINYSTAPCKENKDKTGKYNVPEDTVLNYDVIFNEAVKLKDFKFKRERYKREKDSKRSDIDLAYYINDNDGVKLYVRVFNEVEYVGRVEFYLSEKDKKKFECKNSESAAVNSIAEESKNIKPLKTASKIKFSSFYTKLDSKTCKPLSKPESDEDDVPYICTGYKGYKIYINTHGIANFYIGREISKNMDSWTNLKLPSFILNAGLNQAIEWRLADGEPFACIVRAEYDKQIFNADEKGKANELVVQNLRGFAPISVLIDAQKNERANEEARRRADAGYNKF